VDVQEGYNINERKLTNIINTIAPLQKVVISEKHPISNHVLRSYCPISLLCSLGKVHEKCLLNVMKHLGTMYLSLSFQHGFRKNHSTATAALTVQNIIAKAMDNKKVIFVSTDVSAAFDCWTKPFFYLACVIRNQG